LTFRAVVAHAPVTPVFGLAAGGVAMQALLDALADTTATVARTMSFHSPAVQGIAVAGKTGFGAVLVNRSRKPFLISVPKLLRGLPYTERWAAPITLVAGTATLRNETGATGAVFALPPFSLLRIGKG
jgi:uncharacterized protein YebE (UPF0316 family)